MAARLRKFHQDDVRKKIRTSQLIKVLQDYALGEITDKDFSVTRLRAIDILLKKTLPDLTAVTVSGEDGEDATPIKFTFEVAAPVGDVKVTNAAAK